MNAKTKTSSSTGTVARSTKKRNNVAKATTAKTAQRVPQQIFFVVDDYV